MKSNIKTEKIRIPVSDRDSTSGILSRPVTESRGTAIILAHGAANDMKTPLMVAFSEGLSRAGYPVLRFNFLYAERGRKTPDRETLLASAWAAAYRFLREDSGLSVSEIVAAGKSMGGKVASQMAANGELKVNRLIFLGYPLHRMGDPSILHDSHLYKINVPLLFIEGTRDSLCDMTALRGVLARLKVPHSLFSIEGGDHSFHVPKSAGVSEEEIYARIVAKTTDWLSGPLP